MAEHLSYYEYDASEVRTCATCGWSGPTSMGEPFRDLFEVDCPSCHERIALVSWPTVEETKAAAAAGNPRAKAEMGVVAQMEARWARFEEGKLRSADQLPELDGDELRLVWAVEEADGEMWTLIRHGERVLYRELALYEGFDRFAEVVGILRECYAERLVDVEPERDAWTYLYGDDFHWGTRITDEARGRLGPGGASGA